MDQLTPSNPTKLYKLKVISGGQSGADRIGLEVATALGIPTGGTAPQGFKTENGPDLSLKTFGLQEGPAGYKKRTMINVDKSDGTLAIRLHESSGTDYTIGYAQKKTWAFADRGATCLTGYKPVLVISDLDDPENASRIVEFIRSQKIYALNVAGHRETTSGVENFGDKLRALLKAAFILLGATQHS